MRLERDEVEEMLLEYSEVSCYIKNYQDSHPAIHCNSFNNLSPLLSSGLDPGWPWLDVDRGHLTNNDGVCWSGV